MTGPVLEMKKIKRTFHQGGKPLHVLRGASLTVAPGEIVGLLGPSGAGKSTLLQIAGLLEPADAGSVKVEGRIAEEMNDHERTLVRRGRIGFIYQFHHLLAEFTALENVAMPLRISGNSEQDANGKAKGLLGKMGLRGRLEHRPSELSGGEQQRVAIARALANQPILLVADEPTGNLDEATADKVFDILLKMARKQNAGALIATHNLALAGRMDRCVHLHDGKLYDGAS